MAEAVDVSGVAQLAISVKDLDKSVAFYRDVLGMTFLFKAPPQMAFLQCGATRLMLSAGANGPVESRPIAYYAVPDIQAAFTALTWKGAPVKQAPQMIARLGGNDLWLGFTEDPDGHPVGLMSEVPVRASEEPVQAAEVPPPAADDSAPVVASAPAPAPASEGPAETA